MMKSHDTILEVEKLSKLYSRNQGSSRQRMSGAIFRTLIKRPPKIPSQLKPGEFWSLRDINFSLKRGEAIGVIGLNGAGKSTLLRILSGQILPDAGEARIQGQTAAMIDLTAGFSANASGRRNITLRGTALGRSTEEIEATIQDVIDFSELGEAIDAPFATYSSGMRMRLAFSIMMVSEPDLLFIDEILSVGDFRFKQKCLQRIRDIRERVAFVLVSHSMANIKLFCTKAMVLHRGEMVYLGDPEEAIERYQELESPEANTYEKRIQTILKPQFRNNKSLEHIRHYWCDQKGNEIDQIKSGEMLYFKTEITLNYVPRNLVLGVPVWQDDGKYVTGFSTEFEKKKFDIQAGVKTEFILEVPNLPFNPGEYVSNFAVSDGPEFLYRGVNPTLTVLPVRDRVWGVVTIPHSWKSVEHP
jgi:ABC-type polysaccharide/polyol phosphate transport system ATPase subunit